MRGRGIAALLLTIGLAGFGCGPAHAQQNDQAERQAAVWKAIVDQISALAR